MTPNSRHLSVAEYFDQLQREYLIAEFRKKIYYSPKDKRYYDRVMGHKREKIEDIAKRNNLVSIFSSKKKRDEFRTELYNRNGRPLWKLTDEDWKFYFTPGNEFSYKGDIYHLDQINEDGTLKMYNPAKGLFDDVEPAKVTRIL